MNIPLEVTYKNLRRNQALESLIEEKASKLEKTCNQITRCRVAIERPHLHHRKGNPFRVRIGIMVPPGRELVVDRELTVDSPNNPLPSIIRGAFESATRKVKNLHKENKRSVSPKENIQNFSASSEASIQTE